MKTFVISAAAIVFALPITGQAANDPHSHHQATKTAAAPVTAMVDGVVKKIDKKAGKVTLSHGPLTNLNMPPMTMAFAVKDAAWLDSLKESAKVRFMAERVDGVFTVVHLEPAAQ